MNAKHTPTPWHTVRDNHISLAMPWMSARVVFVRGGSDTAYVPPSDGDNGNANAALIVRAVNHHEALVAALRGMANDDGVLHNDDCGLEYSESPVRVCTCGLTKHRLDYARAVLADVEAEGGAK